MLARAKWLYKLLRLGNQYYLDPLGTTTEMYKTYSGLTGSRMIENKQLLLNHVYTLTVLSEEQAKQLFADALNKALAEVEEELKLKREQKKELNAHTCT